MISKKLWLNDSKDNDVFEIYNLIQKRNIYRWSYLKNNQIGENH